MQEFPKNIVFPTHHPGADREALKYSSWQAGNLVQYGCEGVSDVLLSELLGGGIVVLSHHGKGVDDKVHQFSVQMFVTGILHVNQHVVPARVAGHHTSH